jgi:hypothetical protein
LIIKNFHTIILVVMVDAVDVIVVEDDVALGSF